MRRVITTFVTSIQHVMTTFVTLYNLSQQRFSSHSEGDNIHDKGYYMSITPLIISHSLHTAGCYKYDHATHLQQAVGA
jgi:hypothetical protein